ncbi:MAG: chromosome segregation protein SMC [Clostridiales bacterium]|nr:chromosome segregation protein SMC [Clostridiales bacterium]
MKFKKLEVAGFKSFADKLEIKFGGGVTAIVGPNGCGKSNVADAIRWVLGEQSAKLLRGNSMQDVIFNGTENRKSLSYCEVDLYFDNTEKLFPTLDYNEVVISRKLYRSGESEYLLNKNNVRLKDITDLLRDGGMGREGYSIIGQGRIDELLSAKPEDRRAIFEEAAGISKFKARKLEAERKLNRTRENLVRITDILEEKARQLDPLTKQAEAARKFLDLRDKLKAHEINIYIHQYDTASQAKGVIADRLKGINEEIDLRQKDCEAATAAYNEAMANLGDTDKTIASLRETLLDLTVGMEKTAGDVRVKQERLHYLKTQSERLKAENTQTTADVEQLEAYIAEGEKQIVTLGEEFAKASAEAEKHNDNYLQTVDTLVKGDNERESSHRAVVEAMTKIADIQANMSHLLAERSALTASEEDLTKRISDLADRLQAAQTAARTAKTENEAFTEQKRALSEEAQTLQTRNNEYIAIINEAAKEIDTVSAQYYMQKSKHKMLTEMQQSYEGFAYSVKKLLTDAKSNPELAKRIEGVTASLLRVNEGFESAIEMALGAAVQHIVTGTEEDAKYLIEYLKSGRLGRATFLPVTSVKPRFLEPEYKGLLTGKGIYGIAVDLVSFDPKYTNVFNGLLGNTVVVQDMDVAIALARAARYGFKIVTLDGDVINPHGSITGGSKKSELTNVFGYEKEIAALAETLATMDKTLTECNAKRDEAAKSQASLSERMRAVREQIHALDMEIAAHSEAYNAAMVNADELQTQANALGAEREKASCRIADITREIDSVEELEQVVRDQKANEEAIGGDLNRQFDELRKQRDELHELATKARAEASALQAQKASAENEVERLKSNLASAVSKIEFNTYQINENDTLIAQIDADIRALTEGAGANDSDRVKEIRFKLTNLDDFKKEVQDTLTELDGKRMALMNLLQDLHEKKNREEVQLVKVDTDIEQMRDRVFEEYQLEYDACLPFKQEDYNVDRGMSEAAHIRRQIKALGDVNVGAIEQSREVYESYHALDVQKEDLQKAEADLVKIITDLSKEMLEKFTDQFAQIRTNFVKIFKELFDGGTADLLLLENENPLEAGIEIVAQPPQKKLQSISLLSGGERALTAIAILFAILRLKPMPFCVLDEIEAALDDANAGRFAQYLRRFSEGTQFIVITHRKPTMELADNLYGVTMEEKGVSKIVSVKLSEAVALENEK